MAGQDEFDDSLRHFKALSEALDERLRKRAQEPKWDADLFRKSLPSAGPPAAEASAASAASADSAMDVVAEALFGNKASTQQLQAAADEARAAAAASRERARARPPPAMMRVSLLGGAPVTLAANYTSLLRTSTAGFVGTTGAPGMPAPGAVAPSPVLQSLSSPPLGSARPGGDGSLSGAAPAPVPPMRLASPSVVAEPLRSASPAETATYRATPTGTINLAASYTGYDAEIDAYVGDYKFEQYAPEAALVVQTAWRAQRVRVFFNRYWAVRQKHLRRQLRLAFSPLKQLVLAVLHARRRLLRRAFEEWREWIRLSDELFLRFVIKLRASIGSVKEHATPQQLWQLCTPPGGDPWAAKLTLGALVANVLRRQMPSRTAAMYLTAWRKAVANQVVKRQAAGEVLRRMDQGRFKEYVRLLFRFWFRWAIIQVSERLQIPPPIFRPRIPEWDAWLFKHTRSRELHSRIVLLHKHFFNFWVFFTRRNKKMRQAWITTAAQHIEAILRNAINAFKANAAEARRQRRIKRAVFEAVQHITRRNIAVRRIAREVAELSRRARMRLALRRFKEWARMSKLLNTAASIQIMSRRATSLCPMYAMLDDATHMWFIACWSAWRNFVVGRLRMRCLLGLHMSRAATANMEAAFKALRKWAELQRRERARLALERMRAAAGESVDGATPTGASDGGASSQTPRASELSGAGDGEALAAPGSAGGRSFELFVSMADYPIPAGATWRSPLEKQQLLGELEKMEGPFYHEAGERLQILNVVRHREITNSQRQWIDIEHPISHIYLGQAQKDPRLWQRLVGLVASDMPHPDHPAAHMIDQARLPLADAVAAIRREPAGILLPEQQQDTLLMHKVCEAEDFLDTVLHVVLAAGGAETPMLRRALGGRVPRGTLLGDALVMTLSGALASDLLTAAAELRHRTNRDRVITLGVDLAEKAKAFAGHRPDPGRGRWRNVKAAALSKSAVIRMEMMTGRPQKGEPGSPSAVAAGHGAPMLATARRAMENRRVRGSGSPSLSPTRGRDAGGTGRSIAFDLGVDGAADSPGGWAGSDGDLSRGTTPQRGEALTRAASRVGSVAGGRRNSMKSQASSVWGRESTAAGGMSLRNLVEGFSFSGPGGADSTVAEEAEPSEAEAEQAFTPRTEEEVDPLQPPPPVNNFLYLTVPGILTTGKILNPAGEEEGEDDGDEPSAAAAGVPKVPIKELLGLSFTGAAKKARVPGSRPQFHVTAQQLNIFMGGHLRRGHVNSAASGADGGSGAAVTTLGGLTLTADGILVTPYGVQIVREENEEEMAEAEADGDEPSGGPGRTRSAFRTRRTKTVVVREVVASIPFEEQFDFRGSVWIPPEARSHMLDDYDLAAELAAGRAGDLGTYEAPNSRQASRFGRGRYKVTDAAFMTESEDEAERARQQRAQERARSAGAASKSAQTTKSGAAARTLDGGESAAGIPGVADADGLDLNHPWLDDLFDDDGTGVDGAPAKEASVEYILREQDADMTPPPPELDEAQAAVLRRGALTGHATRGLLDSLEEALASSLDPERLTGLTLQQYNDELADLAQRLIVAPATLQPKPAPSRVTASSRDVLPRRPLRTQRSMGAALAPHPLPSAGSLAFGSLATSTAAFHDTGGRRRRQAKRPRLTAAKLQVALARRAALRSALEARGELLALDEMDLEELEEESELVDRLVEASIRVYGAALAQRQAQRQAPGSSALAGGAVNVPGEGPVAGAPGTSGPAFANPMRSAAPVSQLSAPALTLNASAAAAPLLQRARPADAVTAADAVAPAFGLG
eukprot:XP_001690085.1 predicted protein [Chlamydomonas reinhardtii]